MERWIRQTFLLLLSRSVILGVGSLSQNLVFKVVTANVEIAVSQDIQVPGQPITPRALRAPELIRRDNWDANIDIWCLGCLVSLNCSFTISEPANYMEIFEFATNEPLFTLNTFGVAVEYVNKEHESLICDRIGNGGGDCRVFSDYLKQRLPPTFGERDIQPFAAFLRSMLQTNPRQRSSSAQLVRHSLLVDGLGCDTMSSEISRTVNKDVESREHSTSVLPHQPEVVL